jgi:hypothetical protein
MSKGPYTKKTRKKRKLASKILKMIDAKNERAALAEAKRRLEGGEDPEAEGEGEEAETGDHAESDSLDRDGSRLRHKRGDFVLVNKKTGSRREDPEASGEEGDNGSVPSRLQRPSRINTSISRSITNFLNNAGSVIHGYLDKGRKTKFRPASLREVESAVESTKQYLKEQDPEGYAEFEGSGGAVLAQWAMLLLGRVKKNEEENLGSKKS